MAFIKEEREELRIEEVFSVKQEEPEEHTEPMVLKEECEGQNDGEDEHRYKTEDDFTTEEKASVSGSNTEAISSGNAAQTTGRRDFPCPQCGQTFRRKLELNRHARIHTEEQPHVCQQCGKSFLRKFNLNRHERIHSGEKPYTCPKCGKSYNQVSVLNRHMVIHVEEREDYITLVL